MKGVYILLLIVKRDFKISVGSLGVIKLQKGSYAYVGSAQNNIRKRIERHLKKDKKKFWHIDYIIDNKFVIVKSVFYKEANKEQECKLAKRLIKIAKPIKKLGCSDCKCISHFFAIKNIKNFKHFLKKARMKEFRLTKSIDI